jgi:hypothetical protein
MELKLLGAYHRSIARRWRGSEEPERTRSVWGNTANSTVAHCQANARQHNAAEGGKRGEKYQMNLEQIDDRDDEASHRIEEVWTRRKEWAVWWI